MPSNSARYWQDNAHKKMIVIDILFLINEHSPKENEILFALKDVVFDKTL